MEPLGVRCGGQDAHRIGVGRHLTQAGVRILGVQRQVGRAAAQHPEERGHQVDGPGQGDGDHRPRPGTGVAQHGGQALGVVEEFAIGDGGAVPSDERDRVGRRVRLCGDPLVHPCGGHLAGDGRADEGRVLVRVEHAQVGHAGVRGLRGVAEQAREPVQQGRDGGVVEQVGGIPRLDAHTRVGGLDEPQVEVEHGGTGRRQIRLRRDAWQRERDLLGAVVCHRDLEHRVAAQQAGGGEPVHDPRERHVGLCERRARAVPDLVEQRPEGRPVGQIRAQDDGVHEQADDVVQILVGAARDRDAHGDVVASADPVEQGGHAGVQHGGQAGVVGPGEGPQGGDEFRGQQRLRGAAAQRRFRRSGPVGRQRGLLGQTGQLLVPVIELTCRQGRRRRAPAAQQVALPDRVGRVGDGRRRGACEFGGPRSGGAGGVRGGEVRQEGAVGPPVGRGVMQRQDQVGALAGREHGRSEREIGGQVERARHRRGDVRGHPRGRGLAQVHDIAAQPCRGLGRAEHVLRGPVRVVGGGQQRAQRLVAADDIADRGPQRGRVHGAGQLQRQRQVVRGRRSAQLLLQPQPGLRERRRDHARNRRAPHARTCGPRLGRHGGQPFRGRCAEHVGERYLDVERGPQPVGQARGQEGMAAEGEEVVVGADARQTEQFGEQGADGGLAVVRGGASGGPVVGGGPGSGECGAVDLAAGVEREFAENGERGRDERGRQGGGQGGAYGRGVQVGPVGRDQVGGKGPGAVPARHGRHHRAGHARESEQSGLDLARLDPDAADLHLVVGAAQEPQVARGVTADPVPGAVHAVAGFPEEVGDETLGGLAGASQVAAGEPGSREVEVARHAVRHRSQVGIEHVRTGVGDGTPDRHRSGGAAGVGEAVARGLGAAVQVEDPGLRPPGGDRVREGRRKRFSRGDPGGDGRERAGRGGVEQGREQTGDHGDDLHAVRVDQVGEPPRVGGGCVVGEDDGVPGREAAQEFGAAVDEREGALGHADARTACLPAPPQAVGECGVCAHNGLGTAGRAGGEDDVGGAVGGDGGGRRGGLGGLGGGFVRGRRGGEPRRRVRPGGGGGRLPGVDAHQPGPGRNRQVGRGRRVAQHHFGPCVAEHERDAVARLVEIQREIRGPGPEDGQQGRGEVGGAGECQRDHGLAGRERPGVGGLARFGARRVGQGGAYGIADLGRPFPQLAVGQCAFGDHGGGVRRLRDLSVEQCRDAARRDRGGRGLLGRDDVAEQGQRCVRSLDGGRQGGLEVREEGVDALGGEQARAIRRLHDQRARPQEALQCQVELRGAVVDVPPRGGHSGQVQLRQLVREQAEHDVEQRRAAGAAVRAHRVQDLVERHVLVREGGLARLGGPGHELTEGQGGAPARWFRHIAAQDHGVAEVADEAGRLRASAVHGERADGQVVRAGAATQYGGEPGKGRGERGRSLGGRERRQSVREFGGQAADPAAAALVAHRGTPAVRGQFGGLGKGLEPVAPERHAFGIRGRAGPLPGGEVRVLDLGRFRRGRAVDRRPVERGQVAGQHAPGAAVPRDVVDDLDQGVRLRSEPQQFPTGRVVVGEVEGPGRQGHGRRIRRLAVLGGRERGEVAQRDVRLRCFGRHLAGHTVVVDPVDGAQEFVAYGQAAQSGPQRRGVQRAGQLDDEAAVVGGAVRVCLVVQPQAVLRVGQRRADRPVADRDPAPGAPGEARPGQQTLHQFPAAVG